MRCEFVLSTGRRCVRKCETGNRCYQHPSEEQKITNEDISLILRDLSDLYSLKGDIYRAKTFDRASKIIRNFRTEITDPDRQLVDIPGIGQGVRDRVKEYLSTGFLKELSLTRPKKKKEKSSTDAYNELLTVYGIGEVTAAKLVKEGIRGFDDLVQKVQRGEIVLNEAQKTGVKYHKQMNEKVPREEVKEIGNFIISVIKSLDPEAKAQIVGSYRRGKKESGDVDILFTGENNLQQIVGRLGNKITKILSLGQFKFQGLYGPYPRKLDIRWVPPISWPTALLHATGSDQFNVNLRKHALFLGMSLSEHGLFSTVDSSRIPVNSEEDVFKELQMKYIPPFERTS